MTTPRDAAVSESYFRRNYPNLALNSINQGDFLYQDQSTLDVKVCTTDANAAYFVGVADETYPGLSEVPNLPKSMPVLRHQRVRAYLQNGVTATASQRLYLVSVDAQTLTNVPGSNYVGKLASLPDGTQNSVTASGTTTTIFVDLENEK